MFNFIDIYICIPVSGCVGRGLSVLLFPGAYDAVQTALSIDSGFGDVQAKLTTRQFSDDNLI
jgi:hypothetical protein